MSEKVRLIISSNLLALVNDDNTVKHVLIHGNDKASASIISGTVDSMQKVIIACENAVINKGKAEIVFDNCILVFEPQYHKNTNKDTIMI